MNYLVAVLLFAFSATITAFPIATTGSKCTRYIGNDTGIQYCWHVKNDAVMTFRKGTKSPTDVCIYTFFKQPVCYILPNSQQRITLPVKKNQYIGIKYITNGKKPTAQVKIQAVITSVQNASN